jgi:N-acyl-D-aspartate/D-glutamate deacylase
MGYHFNKILKGTYGEASKIEEEFNEFIDALEQDNNLMALIELSDLLGAIKGYLENHHPSITLFDLEQMAKSTERAFKDGTRK